MRGWIEWFAQGLRKRRRPILMWGALSVFVIGVAFVRSYDFAGRPDRTINDAQFERAANAICTKEIPPLRAVKRQGETEDDLEKETATQVDRAADRLEKAVARLRELQVREQDRPEVAAWFGHFDDYITAGRHYADALRGGNEDVYNKVDDEGIEPLKAISRFARANRIDDCIP